MYNINKKVFYCIKAVSDPHPLLAPDVVYVCVCVRVSDPSDRPDPDPDPTLQKKKSKTEAIHRRKKNNLDQFTRRDSNCFLSLFINIIKEKTKYL